MEALIRELTQAYTQAGPKELTGPSQRLERRVHVAQFIRADHARTPFELEEGAPSIFPQKSLHGDTVGSTDSAEPRKNTLW